MEGEIWQRRLSALAALPNFSWKRNWCLKTGEFRSERGIAMEEKRPLWEEIAKTQGYIACECGHILPSLEDAYEHWEAGHFDSVEDNDVKEKHD